MAALSKKAKGGGKKKVNTSAPDVVKALCPQAVTLPVKADLWTPVRIVNKPLMWHKH